MGVEMMIKALFFCLMVRMSVEVTKTTHELFSKCEGEDMLLMWNYTTEQGLIRELQWFYNNTTLICSYSESKGFYIQPLYNGRVERNGAMGILLRKVNSSDTGEYTLFPTVHMVRTENITAIYLTVLEKPTNQCQPNITIHSKNIISCSTNSCGRQSLSHEWRIFGKKDPVGNEKYLEVNSSWTDKHVLCCLSGPNMKCSDGDRFEFCTLAPIASTYEAPHDKDTASSAFSLMLILLLLAAAFILLIVLMIVLMILVWRIRKFIHTRLQNANTDVELNDQMTPTVAVHTRLQNANTDVELNDQMTPTVAVHTRLQNANTDVELNDQMTPTVAVHTRLQNANTDVELNDQMTPTVAVHTRLQNANTDVELNDQMTPTVAVHTRLQNANTDVELNDQMTPTVAVHTRLQNANTDVELNDQMTPTVAESTGAHSEVLAFTPQPGPSQEESFRPTQKAVDKGRPSTDIEDDNSSDSLDDETTDLIKQSRYNRSNSVSIGENTSSGIADGPADVDMKAVKKIEALLDEKYAPLGDTKLAEAVWKIAREFNKIEDFMTAINSSFKQFEFSPVLIDDIWGVLTDALANRL